MDQGFVGQIIGIVLLNPTMFQYQQESLPERYTCLIVHTLTAVTTLAVNQQIIEREREVSN